jgi:dienelactone hydrolase
MTDASFPEFIGRVMGLYHNQSYAEALELLTQSGDRFPGEAPIVLYLRSCMAARVEQPELAIQVLREALERGIWVGETTMRESPSLRPLQGRPDFEELVDRFKELRAAAKIEPQRFIVEPEGGCNAERPCPLLIALHGNNSNAAAALHGWRPAVDTGWLLAALQSSQAEMTDMYVWDDQDTALREVAQHYAALREEYAIDPERVVVAGFSMGGETALRAVLNGTVPVRAFVLLGPGGPTIGTPETWLPLIEQAAARGVRGYVLLGERDDAVPHENIRALVELLNTNGVPCELEMIPNLGHAYPDDIAPYQGRALAFIL